MINFRDNKYAQYITIGVIACIVTLGVFWIFRMQPDYSKNTDPRKGRVCFDAECWVSKECDLETLVISTTLPGSTKPSIQRVSNSGECG